MAGFLLLGALLLAGLIVVIAKWLGSRRGIVCENREVVAQSVTGKVGGGEDNVGAKASLTLDAVRRSPEEIRGPKKGTKQACRDVRHKNQGGYDDRIRFNCNSAVTRVPNARHLWIDGGRSDRSCEPGSTVTARRAEDRTGSFGDGMALLSYLRYDAKSCPAPNEIGAATIPPLKTGGLTNLGAAIKFLQGRLDQEIRTNTPEQKGDYKPLVFIMTDANPTDHGAWEQAVQDLRENTGRRAASIIALGCGPSINAEVLEAARRNHSGDAGCNSRNNPQLLQMDLTINQSEQQDSIPDLGGR